MSGIGIITNPHSKLNKRNPRRQALLGYILGEAGKLEVTNSLEDLQQVAREFRSRQVHTLAINGGDGTISRTLTALVHEYGRKPLPRIALLRGGTINVLANNLKIFGSPEQILFRLTETIGSGKALSTRSIPTLKVGENYGFLFGNGVAATFLKEYYKRKSGPVGAAWWVMRVWASRFGGGQLYNSVVQDHVQTLKPAGGSPIQHSTCAVFCSTLEKLPLGYPLFRDLRGCPDQFQVVSFTFPARAAVWQLPLTLVKIGKGSSKGKMSFCANRLWVDADGGFDYTLDGELFECPTRSLEIGLGPSVEFIRV